MPEEADAQTPDPTTDDAANEDAIYDQALTEMLAGDEGAGAATETESKQDQPAGDATAGQSTQQSTELDETQQRLLSKAGMTPEMVAGWTDEQRQGWFEHAAKREADQTQFGQQQSELIKRLEKLEQGGQEGGKETNEQAKAGDDGDAAGVNDLGESFDTALEGLVETYGDEFSALGPPMKAVIGRANELAEQLQQTQASARNQSRLLVDVVIDGGIRNLTDEYPTLSKAEPRQQVEDKFMELWNAQGSQYADPSKGHFIERVRLGLKAAADAVLGNTTEAAAQASLLEKTKTRLQQQPSDGAGQGSKTPLTEEDIYDQAYAETMEGK